MDTSINEYWLSPEYRPCPLSDAAADSGEGGLSRPVGRWVMVEQSLVSFPLFALHRQDVSNRTSMTYAMRQREGEDEVEGVWRVIAGGGCGYPGPFDRKVFRAIEYLSGCRPPDGEAPLAVSLSEVCRLIGVEVCGPNRRLIVSSLRRLTATTIETGAMRTGPAGQKYVSDTFHLLERVVLRGQKTPDGREAESTLVYLSDWYAARVRSGMVRPLDFAYQAQLQSGLAARLYEILSGRFFDDSMGAARFDYVVLCALAPMARQRHYSRATQSLAAAHGELLETGYLSGVEWRKAAGRAWQIVYRPGRRAHEEYACIRLGQEPPSCRPDVVAGAVKPDDLEQPDGGGATYIELLIQRGIRETVAQRLAGMYPDRIAGKVEVFDWIRAQATQRIGNPAGYLRRMIEEDWPPPSGFRSAADRRRVQERACEVQDGLDRQTRRRQWELWLSGTPEQKIYGELVVWMQAFRGTHGRSATMEERATKREELLARLPEIEAQYRAKLLEE